MNLMNVCRCFYIVQMNIIETEINNDFTINIIPSVRIHRTGVSHANHSRYTTCARDGRKNAIWQQFGQLAIRPETTAAAAIRCAICAAKSSEATAVDCSAALAKQYEIGNEEPLSREIKSIRNFDRMLHNRKFRGDCIFHCSARIKGLLQISLAVSGNRCQNS